MLVPLSASHAHSLANLRKPPDEVVAEVGRIRAARDAAGSRTIIEVGMSTAFGCTIQGRVEPSEVLRLMQAVLDAGADRVGPADTGRLCGPPNGARAFRGGAFASSATIASAAGTFTIRAAWRSRTSMRPHELGVRRFDASLAGIGGCPHAPGASGNASTEDLAYMLASMNIDTGIDLDRLLALRAKIAEWLRGETLHGTLWLAGLPKTMMASGAAIQAA